LRFARRNRRFVAIGWHGTGRVPTLPPSRTDPPFRIRRTKMTSTFGRISENVLFSLLIAMFAGWTVVSVAADAAGPVASSVACTVAKVAAGISNS
jgi:hypothetical protein